MAILKCKMCGGDLVVDQGMTWGTCEHCLQSMTLPQVSDDKRANLYNRANHFRRLNDFDKAMNAYERILDEVADDAEAHWGVVISRYGIEYVEDPESGERVPTSHRVQSGSILRDPDYLAALEHSPDEAARSIYQAQATAISEIQKGILAIAAREEPFDVFICYKESTDSRSRSRDSVLAQDIYDQLIKEKYRVFLSRITLEEHVGREYEPYIFAALNSAKVMLVVGTCPEHFHAVWVRNEWSRFLSLMRRKDSGKLLIPCYKDMDPYDLPEELSALQSQDMGKIGFMQDLVRGIKKVLSVSPASGGSGAGNPPPAAATGIPCPGCGAVNSDTVNFCADCGGALRKDCPECKKDIPWNLKYCPWCGTDGEAFTAVASIAAKMEKYFAVRKWERVVKEHDLLPKGELRLPGENGRNLVAAIAKMKTDADEHLAKIPLLKAEIEELIQRGLNAYLGSLQSEYDSRSIGEGSLSAGIISCDHALHRIEELTEHLENPATADDMRACVLECSGDLRWQMLNAKIEPLVCRGDWAGALEVIDTEGQGRTLEENGLEEMEELPTFTTFAALRTSTLTASRDGRVSGAWCRFISRIREHFTIAAPRYGSWRGARWLTDARRQELATKRQKLVDKLVSVQRRKVIVRRCITASSIIAFVLIAALTINASRRNNAFRRACAAGETAMAADDYATAQGHFANALRIKPGHPATVGRLQQAIENEERSVAEAKRLAEQYMLAVADGQKLLAAEDWPKAEAAFTRALAVKGYGNAPEATTGLRDAKDGAAMQRRKATAKTECDRTIQAATDLLALATNNRAPAAARGQTAEALTAIDRTLTSQKDSLSPSDQSALSALRDRIVTFQGTLKPKVDCTWSVPDLGMVFQPVPAGSFQMGTDVPKVPRSDDEKPQHGVRISQPYWLGNTEITQGQWQAVMGNNPSYVKGVDFPVEMVTWNDAISFCTKLTEREQSAGRLPVGYVYRLPTEAEWEYAARGGRKSKGYEYSGSNNLDDVGWYAKNSGNISKRDVLDTTLKSHPVGRKKPNELGLYDMSGNVEEWCHDWGGKYPPGSVTDPRGAQSGAGRITRGGSWWGEDAFCRSADRNERSPSTRDNRLGFRVCLGSVVQ